MYIEHIEQSLTLQNRVDAGDGFAAARGTNGVPEGWTDRLQGDRPVRGPRRGPSVRSRSIAQELVVPT
jgi:hypothetical protein